MKYLSILTLILTAASAFAADAPTFVLSNGVVSQVGMSTAPAAAPSVVPPMTTTFVGSNGCYYDANGNLICPKQQVASYYTPPVQSWGVANTAPAWGPIQSTTYTSAVTPVLTYCPCTQLGRADGTFTACACTPTANCGSPNCPAVVQARSMAMVQAMPMVGAGWTYSVADGTYTANTFTASQPVRGFFRGLFQRFRDRPRMMFVRPFAQMP